MKLYGTITSPYVRRVRIVAQLVDAPITLVDTSTDEGQDALRTIAPLWKVPVLDGEDKAIFESRVICDYLIRRYGNRNLRTESGAERWREANIVTVIDGALDSAINLFYLRKDSATEVAYMKKQANRVESALNWVEKQLDRGFFSDVQRIGLSEIALFTALGWMQFRETYPVAKHSGLMSFCEKHQDFGPFESTPLQG